MKLRHRIDRILNDIAVITGGSRECNRPSYSAADAEARKYFLSQFESLGLDVRIDGAGNIRAAYQGSEPGLAPVFVGSHIDTVKSGGQLDGLLGTVCALECLRVFKENEYVPHRSVELIIFSEEEGTNFGVTLIGSKLLTGKLSPADLVEIKNDTGDTADSVIRNAGYDPDRFSANDPDCGSEILKPGDVHAMIELHIEQGAVLDRKGISVGVVESIAGMETFQVVLYGVSGHAGAMAMEDRKDPMIGAAEIILGMRKIAKKSDTRCAVATVGKLLVRPGASNIIPGEVELYVDIRDSNDFSVGFLAEELFSLVKDCARRHGLQADVRLMGKSPAVKLDTHVVDLIEKSAHELGVFATRMYSGAVHDSVMMTDIGRVGMIFVPSVGGLSHCPEEETREADIEAGMKVLLESVIKLAEET